MSQLAPVRSSQSDLMQTALQSTQIAASDHSFRSLSESPYTGLPRTINVTSLPATTTSINSDPTPPSNDIAVISRLLPDGLLDNTAPIATPLLQRPSSFSHPACDHTPRATSTNMSDFATPPAQATVQTTSTSDISVSTETQDSPEAKAILEMSKSLVEALERQTFQIEMTKNTLFAFLRGLDDQTGKENPLPIQRLIIHICAINWSSLSAAAVKLQFQKKKISS